MLPAFEAFPKIPRLQGETIITEKVDGTNACVEYMPRGEGGWVMGACSRNRRLVTIETSALYPDHPLVSWHGPDNYGFGAWVVANCSQLHRLGYGRHFGEWYGQGIQRGYGLDHKRFALFREPKCGLEALPQNMDVAPVLCRMDNFSSVNICYQMDVLRVEGSRIVPGFMNPEGVVVYHARSGQLFKLTFEAGPKGQKDGAS